MCDTNAKSECILIKLNYVHLFLNVSVKELRNFMRKYYLIAELLIFKYRWQNICFQYSGAYCSPEVTLCCENPFDVLAIGDGVGYCGQSGAYRLVLYWSRYKGERPALSRCLASSTASTSHSRPVWRLLYFSTGQRSCPQGAWDRAAVNLWNTRLHRSSSVAANSPHLNPADYQTWGKHRSRMYHVDQLKSRLIEEWNFHQVFIDEAIRQWRPRLRAYIRAHGGHFELRL